MLKANQPEFIYIDDKLRLRKFDGIYNFALQWYQDNELVRLVDGENAQIYDENKLSRMYKYLDNAGELYFIEYNTNNQFIPIGDVAFWIEDMPIVIGEKDYRGKGIGCKVIKSLIQRAKELGYEKIFVNEIYLFNQPSQKAFEKAGFRKYKETSRGYSYVYYL